MTNTECTGTAEAICLADTDQSARAEILARAVGEYVQRGDQNVVINLSGIDRPDSGTLAVLAACHIHLSQAGRTMTVLCDDKPLIRTLEFMRLGSGFVIQRSQNDT